MAVARAWAAILVVIVAAVTAMEGGHGAPTAAADCASVVLSMADCLSYVTDGSTVEKPEGNCCSGLKSVLKTNPDCLCQALKSSSEFGVIFNVSRALGLPATCGVHAPSATSCASGAPAGGVNYSPAGSPSSPIANAPSATERTPAEPLASPSSSSSIITVSIDLMIVIMGIAAAFFSSF